MPYEPLAPTTMLPVAAAVWGPFPLRRARLGFALLALGLGVILLVGGMQRQVVTCARSGALAAQCTWQTGQRENSVRRFPLAALHAVRVAYSETSNKGHTTRWGQLVLDVAGHELLLLRQKADAAEQNAAALQTFLREPAQQTVRIDTGWSVGTLLCGGAFALVGAGMLYSVWYGRRRFHFTWEPSVQQLAMQPKLPLGMTTSSAATWSLHEPVEVEIQWQEVKDVLTSSRAPGPRGGRLQVRLASGNTVALLPYPMPGYNVHIAAAAQLRRLLRCPPATPQAAARIAASYEAERPQLAPGWTGLSGRIAATWIGACCGSVLGIGVGGIGALLLGFAKPSDSADGPWFFGGLLGGAAAGIALAWRIFLRPDDR